MARRGKTSPAEDLMDIVAMLPWWVGVMLALLSYLLLHSVASQQVVATAQPGQVGAMVTQTLWKTLASVGQYILPILCLGGAGMSAWRRKARQNLVTDVAQSRATDALDGSSPLVCGGADVIGQIEVTNSASRKQIAQPVRAGPIA